MRWFKEQSLARINRRWDIQKMKNCSEKGRRKTQLRGALIFQIEIAYSGAQWG